MRQSTRALSIVIVALALAAGCSRASLSTSTSSAPAPSAAITPIPGHPPVTETGVVAKIDPTAGVLAFQDGRTVQLTPQSRVLTATLLQPLNPAAIRPGYRLVVQNALPIGLPTVGTHQHIGTVSAVNHQRQTVQLTDGSVIHITPSTSMHKGMEGASILLTDLRPGDEIVVIFTDNADVSAAPASGPPPATLPSTTAPTTSYPTAGSQPSASPRSATTGSPAAPRDANELMVF